VERSSVREEADLNTVAVISWVIKLTAVVRFGSNYVVLALLLSSQSGTTRSDEENSTEDSIESAIE
jgi:hypothetical protein